MSQYLDFHSPWVLKSGMAVGAKLEIPRLCRGDSRIFKIGKLPVKPLGEVVYQPENNGAAAE